MANFIKTGNIVNVSGQYRPIENKTEFTFVKENRVPPTLFGTTKFVLVDKTKHKS